jgi:hypothetical protein
MPPIDHSWPDYFRTRHEGLGTTYERLILQRIFEDLHGTVEIDSVLEAPCFGMTGITGINSVWWARQGAEVTVADHHPERLGRINGIWAELGLEANLVEVPPGYRALPFDDRRFDLSWNFAALQQVDRRSAFLGELARVSRRAILLCVPNRGNLLHRIRTQHLDSTGIIEEMERLGWRLERRGLFDTPPWPDIAMNKEDLLGPLGRPPARPLCILDHYNGRDPDLPSRVLRYGFLEGLPEWLKRFWAHHEQLLFLPGRGGAP